MNNKIKGVLVVILLACIINVSVEANVFNFIFQKLFSFPTCEKAQVKFSTVKSKLPDKLDWKEIGFGKELINVMQKVVVIAGGSNPISMEKWTSFRPFFPWQKNINRNLLFNKTVFLRSPYVPVDCQNKCVTQREYKGYTWVDIAKPVCIDFIPGETNILKPNKGYLVVKTIEKCQVILYLDFVYQLTDNKGNFYAMHAFENNAPDTNVVLPVGWTIKKLPLSEPLIISPFGGGDDCYFNIIGDHLGQGYHQYIFADDFYPKQ